MFELQFSIPDESSEWTLYSAYNEKDAKEAFLRLRILVTNEIQTPKGMEFRIVYKIKNS